MAPDLLVASAARFGVVNVKYSLAEGCRARGSLREVSWAERGAARRSRRSLEPWVECCSRGGGPCVLHGGGLQFPDSRRH